MGAKKSKVYHKYNNFIEIWQVSPFSPHKDIIELNIQYKPASQIPSNVSSSISLSFSQNNPQNICFLQNGVLRFYKQDKLYTKKEAISKKIKQFVQNLVKDQNNKGLIIHWGKATQQSHIQIYQIFINIFHDVDFYNKKRKQSFGVFFDWKTFSKQIQKETTQKIIKQINQLK